MSRITEAVNAALKEASILDPLLVKDKEETYYKKDFKEESDSGDAGAYLSPKAFRKKMQEMDMEDDDIEDIIAQMSEEMDADDEDGYFEVTEDMLRRFKELGIGFTDEELTEMDDISWNKKSGASLDPHPRRVGNSLDDEEIEIDEMMSPEEDEDEMDEAHKAGDPDLYEPIRNIKKARGVKESKSSCSCGGKKKSVLREALDYTEELYADDIDAMEAPTQEEKDTEDYMVELYFNLLDLFGDDYEKFVTSIDYVAPNPPTFRIILANGYNFYMTLTDRGATATIEGKKYYLSNLDEEEMAAQHIARVLSYGKTELEDTEY